MNQNPDDIRTAGLHRGPNHIDYRETSDVTNVHAAVQREHSVGTPGAVPMPLWLMALCGIAIFWAGTSFSGGFGSSYFSPDNYSVHPGETAGTAGGAGGGPAVELTPAEQGKIYFAQTCAACHQLTGVGVPGTTPPLAGSEFVNGGSRRLCMIVLKGLSGPVTVEGKPFNGAMPTWAALTDKKIASILTYVRGDFGNHGGPITPEQIAAARKDYTARTDAWAAADINAVPADQEIPGGAASASVPTAAPAASPAAAGGAK